MSSRRKKAGDERIPFETGDFYLNVARRALEELRALPADGVLSGGFIMSEGKLVPSLPSDHFRHAVTCTVFSAAAVEHSLVALALLRKMSAHPPERELVRALWPNILTASGLVRIARAVSKLEEPLLSRITGLMKRRNEIVHSQAFDWVEPLEGQPGWKEWGFELPSVTPAVIRDAPGDLAIAEEAVPAIRAVRGDPRWSPFERNVGGEP